jgi:hypothetical protein
VGYAIVMPISQYVYHNTFIPFLYKEQANCEATVLFPTPPFPDSTKITCFTDVKELSLIKKTHYKVCDFLYITCTILSSKNEKCTPARFITKI